MPAMKPLQIDVLHIDADCGPACSTFVLPEIPDRIVVDVSTADGPSVHGLKTDGRGVLVQINARLEGREPAP